MNVKLINTPNPKFTAKQQILWNRGIEIADFYHYLNTSDSDITLPEVFGEKILKQAISLIAKAANEGKKVLIIVDADCDGYTSAAILINYLYDLFPAWVENCVTWYIHDGKQHGLNDCIDYILGSDFELVICPDSSSNDVEEHQRLAAAGIGCIVLDHHEYEKNAADPAIIINSQDDYPNKELSGAGVTWQFCRYIDSLMKTNYANTYIDLASLGNMADMMSMKSIETKHIINKGLEDKNVTNPFIYGMAEKNRFSLGDKLTPMGVAFYIAPFVNSMVRSGTQEEKELLFSSMLKHKAFELVPSTKRGHKLGETERVVDQALRTATNVKNRQTRAQDAGLELLESMIEEHGLLNHKVLLFLLEPGQVDKNIAGLIANKFMAKYQRPCCILTKVEEKIEGAENVIKVSYQGSARGYDKSGITNFKDICSGCYSVMYAEGHQGAFGLGIECGTIGDSSEEVYGEGIEQFIEYTDKALENMSSEPSYYVDYSWKAKETNPEAIIEIAELENLWGKDMDEPFVEVKNIQITKDMLKLMSADRNPTLKITLPNNVSIIKFHSSQEEYDSLYSEDGYIEINAVCRCNINEWNGNRYAQLFLEEYEKVGAIAYVF